MGKRQIRGEKYDISEIVIEAISSVDAQKNLDTDGARAALQTMGHANPDQKLVTRYARESAILAILAEKTGANFRNQLGKIDFSSNEKAIAGINSYLNRRNAGHRARWTGRR